MTHSVGPIAVYQFALLGYGWKSLLLIFHPINAYLHTALLVTESKYGGKFSEKVLNLHIFLLFLNILSLSGYNQDRKSTKKVFLDAEVQGI